MCVYERETEAETDRQREMGEEGSEKLCCSPRAVYDFTYL